MSDAAPTRYIDDVPLPKNTGLRDVELPLSGEVVSLRPPTGRDRLDLMGGGLHPRVAAHRMLCRCAADPTTLDRKRLLLPDQTLALLALVVASRGNSKFTWYFECPDGCGKFEVSGDFEGALRSAAEDVGDEREGFERHGRRFRHLTVAESEVVDKQEVGSVQAAERAYFAAAQVESPPVELGWADAWELDGILLERWRRGGTDLVIDVECPTCGGGADTVLDPALALLQPTTDDILVQVENITRVLRWPAGDALALSDPVRTYYNERALEISEQQAEEAAKARAK